MTRDELIELLKARRNNDVRVATRTESGGADIIEVTGVSYDERGDFITIDTEETISPLVTFMLDGSVYVEDEPIGTYTEGGDVRPLLVALVEALGGTVEP